VSLSNSTVSGNSALYDGGGIGVRNTAIVNLINSTVSGNTASDDVGGIYARSSSTSVSLINSIVANSLGDGGDCVGVNVTSDSATIIEDGSCSASRFGGPGLLALANNGGATQTHALEAGSLAINTANPSDCPATDQRGEPRNAAGMFFPIRADNGKVAVISLDGECDVGAVEFRSGDL
jgi:hypothetical protein